MSDWSNWAGNERSNPRLTITPSSEADIQQAVLQALESKSQVKPIGASHSFTAIGATSGTRLKLDRMRGLVSHDAEKQQVTLWAGTHLWELPAILDPLGLALPNMGDIDRQTISGATQTGTHGTGLKLGGLATGIVGLTMVDGRGKLVTIDQSTPGDLKAAALSLGALGVIVTLTLQCVPRFLLRADEAPMGFDEVLDKYHDISRSSDHFEFYWFPHTKSVRTKVNTRLSDPGELQPLSSFSRWLDEEFVNNDLLGAVLKLENKIPGMIPAANRMISGVSSKRTYTDWSYKVFVTSRRVRFKESEFALPLEAVPTVIKEIDAMIERKGMRISFPIEVRNAKADDLYLSTANGRESGYVAMHRFHKEDEREYFNELWAIMRAHDGRPHWGKMHDFDVADVEKAYPDLPKFLAVRDKFDPDRVFTNPYLDRVLGA